MSSALKQFRIKSIEIFAILAISVLLLFAIEGFSSIFITLQNSKATNLAGAENIHTQYDSLLGWANKPNAHIGNLYRTGANFTTNKQGFRSAHDYTIEVPAGKTRVICVGDSFTLGYGVDDHDTWPYILSSIDQRLETVNMGQGGYGIDQAYLWYERDGTKLDHHFIIFAFIADDFSRMERGFLGSYPKPYITTEDGRLTTKNIPVPKIKQRSIKSFDLSYLFKNLKLLELWQLVTAKHEKSIVNDDNNPVYLALRIFEELHVNAKGNQKLAIFVYLPTLQDYITNRNKPLRETLKQQLHKKNILFLDLTDKLKEVPQNKIKSYFISVKDVPNFAESAGHYSAIGNQFVASEIYKYLIKIGTLLNKKAHHEQA